MFQICRNRENKTWEIFQRDEKTGALMGRVAVCENEGDAEFLVKMANYGYRAYTGK